MAEAHELLAQRATFWDRPTEPELPRDGSLLRMYPEGGIPRAGSFGTDSLDFDSHWHFHDMHQIVHAFEKAIVVESLHGRHLVPPQLAAWIPAGALHRISYNRVRSGSLFFPAEAIASPGSDVRTVLVTPLMREMLREALRWPLANGLCPLGARFFDAMAGLCEEWIQADAALFLPSAKDRRVQKALDHTLANPRARLGQVCLEAGLSERTLRRRLKAECGLTWEAYRQRARLLRAVALLSEEGLAISTISADCGFENPSAFAKAFRAALGASPRDYRRQMTGG